MIALLQQELNLDPPVVLPEGISYKTLIDPVRFLMTAYSPGRCSDTAADGTPIMETHFVYLPDRALSIGSINRAFADTPWRIAATGEPEARHQGMDFDRAVLALVDWHYRNLKRDRDWLRDFAGPETFDRYFSA